MITLKGSAYLEPKNVKSGLNRVESESYSLPRSMPVASTTLNSTLAVSQWFLSFVNMRNHLYYDGMVELSSAKIYRQNSFLSVNKRGKDTYLGLAFLFT